MFRQLFFAVVSMAIVFSCSKKVHDVDPLVSNPYALKVGNYWIYQMEQIDNDSILSSCLDSVFIEKDTLLRGFTYFMFKTGKNNCHALQINAFRDSSGYLIDFLGKPVHTFEHPGELINANYWSRPGQDTTNLTKFVMDLQDSSFSLPAGNLMGLNCKDFAYNYDHGALTYKVTASTVYAKNIGLIYSHYPYFYKQESGLRSSLIRYKVN